MNKIIQEIKSFINKTFNKKTVEKISAYIRKTFNKDTVSDIKEAFFRDKRYVGIAAILGIFVIVLLVAILGGNKKEEAKVAETQVTAENFEFTDKFEQDDNKEMTKLLEDYYKAYVSGDVEAFDKIAYPMSDNEKSYIKVLSNYYENITNINYYSKPGLKEGSYFVSANIEIKFVDVDTTAPTLDFFYVETNDDGKLYINNLYCIYNLNFMENTCDPDVYAVVQKYMAQEDFVKLQQDVQAKYNEAYGADEKLSAMISSTLNSAIKDWQASLSTGGSGQTEATEVTEDTQQAEEQQAEQPTEEPQVEEQPAEQPAEQPEQAVTTSYKTKDVVNVRDRASKDGALIGVYGEGAILVKTGEEGEWTIIDFNGTPGYVKTEFLDPVTE